MDLRSDETRIQLDPVMLELLALRMADYDLVSSRDKLTRLPNPLQVLASVDNDAAIAFYWGMCYETAIPETVRSAVEENHDLYAAGVLARELIELHGQE